MKTFAQLRSVWIAGRTFGLFGVAVLIASVPFKDSHPEQSEFAGITGFGMAMLGALALAFVRRAWCPACGHRFGHRYSRSEYRSIGDFACAHCGARSDADLPAAETDSAAGEFPHPLEYAANSSAGRSGVGSRTGLAFREVARDVSGVLEGVLEPRETVVWSAHPDPKGVGRRHMKAYLAGIVWMAFVVPMTLDYVFSRKSPWGILFFLPFWAGGLWIVSAPRKARKRARLTTYVVTNRRAIIVIDTPDREVKSLYPEEIRGLLVVERASGFGDLSLQRSATPYATPEETGFWATPRVREAERALEALKATVA